jgi:hypothetical protein
MQKLNWKSLLLVGTVAAIGAAILIPGVISTLRLPVLGWHGLGSFTFLMVLTLLSGRFTVPVTNVDGTSQTHKSVADAFIFLAVMMYTTMPANSFGPAIILAAIVGFISSFSLSERWPTVFAVGASIISTFIASPQELLMEKKQRWFWICFCFHCAYSGLCSTPSAHLEQLLSILSTPVTGASLSHRKV